MIMLTAALVCMALTVYHEARGEPIAGQRAVAHTVMNRVADPRWPNSVCRVTRQKGQFSWIGQVNPLPDNEHAWTRAVLISKYVMARSNVDNTGGATYFHTASIVVPNWVAWVTKTRRIGNHIFYRRK